MAGDRPIAITIAAILYLLGAIAYILGGLALIAIGTAGGILGSTASGTVGAVVGAISVFGALTGVVVIILGILYFLAFYGMWRDKKWGWYIALTFAILSFIAGVGGTMIGGSGIFVLAYSIIILVLLLLKSSKEYFNNLPPAPVMASPSMPPKTQPPKTPPPKAPPPKNPPPMQPKKMP